MNWMFSAVFGIMSAILGLLGVTMMVMAGSRIRDKEKLYSRGERAFMGVLGLLVSALCVLGFMGVGWLALNFHEISGL